PFPTAPPVAGVSGTARTCKCREVGSPACLGTPIDLSEVLIVPASPRAGAELGSGRPRSDRRRCRQGRGGADRGARAHLPEQTRPVRRRPEQVVCTLLPIDLIGGGITEAAATPPVTGGSPIR